MSNINNKIFDSIVIGAGHAGIEAALALAKTGHSTLVCCINLDSVGYLACNPSIGGTAKGHLVREVDALGGAIGIIADETSTQIRMLNSSKGMAVQSLRSQVDKYKYHSVAKTMLEKNPNIKLRQCEIVDIQYVGEKFLLTTRLGETFHTRSVVLATGVYLDSKVLIGEQALEQGPAGFMRSFGLADSIKKLGFEMRRFKTGTPARIHRRSIDTTHFEIHKGDDDIISFSDMTSEPLKNRQICYLGHTNPECHDTIRANLHLTFKYRKNPTNISVGARYCPSIEDKVVKFADKSRHQFFLENEGEDTDELYVQGLSTSLPVEAQQKVYSSIVGLENVEIMRDAYAIEYDCIDSTQLDSTLMSKSIPGLFFAGQICGTSGYEEAAAQGIVAGINSSRWLDKKEPVYFDRNFSYIGVMVDDLVVQGTIEPYRMMTSRAEHRLRIRQDNSWLRLTPIGISIGLVDDERLDVYNKRLAQTNEIIKFKNHKLDIEELKTILDLEKITLSPTTPLTVENFIKINEVDANTVAKLEVFKNFDKIVVHNFVAEIKYSGYIQRLDRELKEIERLQSLKINLKTFENIPGLSHEAVEKLNKINPKDIAQASRISGVTPSDINALIIKLKKA